MNRVTTSVGDPRVWLRTAILVACVVVAGAMTADPDLWGHVRFGGDIVAARAVPRVDPYSFTSDREWVNHEWLAEALMYGAWRAGGATGLVVLKAALLLLVLVVVWRSLGGPFVNPVLRDLLLLLTVVGLIPRVTTLRPQVFSLVAFAFLLAVFQAAERGNRRALLVIPVIFAGWVNLHGGWLVGMGVLAIWAGIGVLETGSWRERWTLVVVCVLAAAATLVNPYGVGMWRFLGETVGLGRADILDWQPMTRAPGGVAAIWAVVCAAWLVLVAWFGRRGRPAPIAITTLLGVAAFRVNRLDAFFVLATAMLLAPRRGRQRAASPGPLVARTAPATAIALAGAALIVVPWSLAARPAIGCIPPQQYLPERDSARFIEANRLSGRMLTWFSYGEYAIWVGAPSLRVSLDGRRETVYSDGVLHDHYAYFSGDAHAADYPARMRADYAWLPNTLPAVRTFERAGWRRLFAGRKSTVFGRPDDSRAYVQPRVRGGNACFPGL